MTEVKQADRMPPTVWGARFIMILQLALSLFPAAIMIGGAVSAPDPELFALLLLPLAIVAFLGWLVFRWSTRRKWVRWSAIAFETIALAGHVITSAVDGEFGWMTVIGLSTLLPLVIVVGLLTPTAGRWFDR
ncbi:hypothetical protein ABZ297_15605 [Nonomuraea sp. NPDC005983]|uniref:hypothetical protein n=1 Tax=Nonomuraea sp. NPDC005983 TaxID=3155595 RepID=UPI0033A1730B